MIGEYEAGTAPTCEPCSEKIACELAGKQCPSILGFNIRLGLLAQIAALIHQDHNPEVRKAAAGALFDAYSDYFPSSEWLDEREWMDACGVAREAVAV